MHSHQRLLVQNVFCQIAKQRQYNYFTYFIFYAYLPWTSVHFIRFQHAYPCLLVFNLALLITPVLSLTQCSHYHISVVNHVGVLSILGPITQSSLMSNLTRKMPSPSADMICGRPSRRRSLQWVRSSLQSAPERRVLDPPPLTMYFLTSGGLDLWPFQLKVGAPLTRALGNFYANFDFSTFFGFRVTSPYSVRDRQTDRQADGRDA